MLLTSGISKPFSKPFILDENALRLICGVLREESDRWQPPHILVFHVEREDGRYYETTSVEDVLQDPNIRGSSIRTLSIELRPPDRSSHPPGRDWTVQLKYTRKRPPDPFTKDTAEMRIAASDREWALLLADKLQPQVERTLRAKSTPRWLALVTTVVLIWTLTTVLWRSAIPPATQSLLNCAFAALFFAGLLLLLTKRAHWIPRFLGPESAFLWGEETRDFSDREQVRQNIKWVVIIGFFVSIAAGLVLAVTPFSR